MKKFFVFGLLIVILIATTGTAMVFLQKRAAKGALQVTATPKSKVFLNGNLVGTTPLCKCENLDMLPVGEYRIKLESEGKQYPAYEDNIVIVESVLTVVDRIFGEGATSEGNVITLKPLDDKKINQLFVLSFPAAAQVFVDKNTSGNTPLLIKEMTESDHEILLKKDGYKERVIRIRAVKGYQLYIIAYLGIDTTVPIALPTTSQITATPSAMPVAASVIVLDTPTGYLNVREENSSTSKKIGTVNPGDSLEMLEEQEDWFKVKLTDGTIGWISSLYAQKVQ